MLKSQLTSVVQFLPPWIGSTSISPVKRQIVTNNRMVYYKIGNKQPHAELQQLTIYGENNTDLKNLFKKITLKVDTKSLDEERRS